MTEKQLASFDVIVRKDSDAVVGSEAAADGAEIQRSEFIKISDYLYASKVSVPADQLAANVKSFLGGLQAVFTQPPEESDHFRVKSISVTAEISAKGTLNILGTGGELAGKGGITFVFERK